MGDAAQLTGASSKSLRRRIERGTLGSIRQGGRRLIPVSELTRVGLLDAGGRPRPAPPAFPSAAGDRGQDQFRRDVQAAPPTRVVPRAPQWRPPDSRPATQPGTLPRSAPEPGPVPGPRPTASPPQVRAPWSGEAVPPRRPTYPAAASNQAPRTSPSGAATAGPAAAAPSGRPVPPASPAPAPSPAPAATPRAPEAPRSGLSPQESRRLSAMVELMMHQTRTINALSARLTRLEARIDDLLGPEG